MPQLIRLAYAIIKPIALLYQKTPAQGAYCSVFAATQAEFSGKYLFHCREQEPSKLAQDEHVAKKLWEESERLCGYSTQSKTE